MKIVTIPLLATLAVAHMSFARDPDAQMKTVLDAHTSFEPKAIENLTPGEARMQPTLADAVKKVMKDQDKKSETVGDIDNTKVEIGDHSVNVRVYTPKGDGPFPVILYIHGGGWVIADLDTYDASARALCNAANAVVVSTHYRQAPEHKFPAAHEDVFAVYKAVVENTWKKNYDSKKVAVVGESAGGNMALAISLMAKEKGNPLPLHQVLVYPVADMTGVATQSKQEDAAAKPLNVAMLDWFGRHLLASEADAKNPYLSPLQAPAESHKGLPPTTIILAQIDPLRSDGDNLAKALQDAGVPTKLKTYEGVTHEFFGMGAVVDKAKEAVDFAAAELKTAFGTK